MWARGSLANPGIQQIAETGAGGLFLEEVAACGMDCGPAVELPCDPMGGTCSGSGIVTVAPRYPYVSTAAMLAPSPDWCARPPPTCLSFPHASPPPSTSSTLTPTGMSMYD